MTTAASIRSSMWWQWLLLGALLIVGGYLVYELAYQRVREFILGQLPLPEVQQPLALAKLGAVTASDWPQWRGPQRDGHAGATGLLQTWPPEGPKLLWTYDNGGAGFAAPAVASGRVFLPGARGITEFLVALDVATGVFQGEAVIGRIFESPEGDGPRSTPTVVGGKVYVLGGSGDLVCLDLAHGTVVWRKNIYADFEGTRPTWGCGESVLVDGDRVVCTPGGPRGAVLALHKESGEVLWRSTEFTDLHGYASLVPAEIHGVRQYIQMTFNSVAGIAATDGKLLWRFPRQGPMAPVPTPIVSGNFVYATSGYGAGCHLIEVVKTETGFAARQVYANKVMKNHHGGVVLVDGHLYGYSDMVGWMCQHFQSGKSVWSERGKLGKGCVSYADGRLYCYGEDDGTLCLVEPSPAGWKEHGRFKIPRQTSLARKNGKIWTHPVIADGKLFLRDQELLFCYDVRGK